MYKTVLLITTFCFLFSCRQNHLQEVLSKLPNDTILSVTSYDGSGQVVHPDIIFDNDTFYLALTPYPYYNDKVENPSVYVSTDGLQFTEATINPLAPTPAYDHNNDPDIFKIDSGFGLLYLKTMRPDSQNLMLLQSRDYCKWQEQTLLHYNLKNKEPFMLSPSVVQAKDSFYLFYANLDTPLHIEMLSGKTFLNWNKGNRTFIYLKIEDGYVPWHLDVTKTIKGYLMLCCAVLPSSENQYKLCLFKSINLKNWESYSCISCKDLPDKKCKYIYRSTALIYSDTAAVWYSFVDSSNIWKLGFKKIPL